MATQAVNLFHQLLKLAVQNGVSDVHLRPGKPPYFRQKNGLAPIKAPALTEQGLFEIAQEVIKEPEARKNIKTLKEHDGSFQLGNICRVRYNFLRYQGKMGFVFRIIVLSVPTVEGLGLMPIIKEIAGFKNGLILVTGATGSGKSSTLAAMIEHINTSRQEHILTIEDPVEFVYQSKKSLITQREIGSDSDSFIYALRSALRQDPDIILIGEMRDMETVQIAVKAAETGHVVFATVHTTDALNTIGRIISMFPPAEQGEVRKRLADNLRATISQRLLPKKGKPGRLCVQEIMVNSPGIRDCILGNEPIEEIYTFIQNGFKEGRSQSFDQVLLDSVKKGEIDIKTALSAAKSKNDLLFQLQFECEDAEGPLAEEIKKELNQAEGPELGLKEVKKPKKEEAA